MRKIHKIIAVVVEGNKFLMVRKAGKDIWTSLGGRIEEGEREEECLKREIKEEFDCEAEIIKKLGDFEDKAVFDEAIVRLSAYLVDLKGKIQLIDPELEEYSFVEKNYKGQGVKLPPSIENQIIPFCVREGILNW